METDLQIYSLIIFFATLLGGLIPLVRKWSYENLHIFLSFGAGIFLGVVFLHLLPESFSDHTSLDKGKVALTVLIGYLLLFFIKRILFMKDNAGDLHSHKIVSITAFIGISVHSLIEGFGLAVGTHQAELGSMIFISIIAHKTTAAFALASLFILSKFSTRRISVYILLFSLMTPLGALMFGPLFSDLSPELFEYLTALTAGTFLYVATGDLLPEVFHTMDNRWLKLVLLVIGVAVISVLGQLGH